MPKYRVYWEEIRGYTAWVEADNEDEAEWIAKNSADLNLIESFVGYADYLEINEDE